MATGSKLATKAGTPQVSAEVVARVRVAHARRTRLMAELAHAGL